MLRRFSSAPWAFPAAVICRSLPAERSMSRPAHLGSPDQPLGLINICGGMPIKRSSVNWHLTVIVLSSFKERWISKALSTLRYPGYLLRLASTCSWNAWLANSALAAFRLIPDMIRPYSVCSAISAPAPGASNTPRSRLPGAGPGTGTGTGTGLYRSSFFPRRYAR